MHDQLGDLDVVVNCAGVAAYGRFEEVPVEVFDAVLATNVHGSANLARAVLPRMRETGHGHLYFVGSITGAMGVPQMSAYVVSKWAIRALARELQLENRDRNGVTVTLVTPGGVNTPIYSIAANFQGRPGKPPPPIYSPEAVARAIVRSLDRPPRRLSVGITNDFMALGFTLLPRRVRRDRRSAVRPAHPGAPDDRADHRQRAPPPSRRPRSARATCRSERVARPPNAPRVVTPPVRCSTGTDESAYLARKPAGRGRRGP